MTENLPPEESLSDELHNLGKNLVEVLRAAWGHPEVKRFQEEIVTGLSDLGSTMKREAENLAGSSAGQQFKSNMEQVGERIRSSEVQDKVRQEVVSALQIANTELQKVIDRWSPPGQASEQTPDEEPGGPSEDTNSTE